MAGLVETMKLALENGVDISEGNFHVKTDSKMISSDGVPLVVEGLMEDLDRRGYASEVNNPSPNKYIVSFFKEGYKNA